MAFEDDVAKIRAVVERARRGDETLSDAQIIDAVNEFDSALTGRVNGERAARLLLGVAAPLCFYRPSASTLIMPIALWALVHLGHEGASRVSSALLGFADDAEQNAELEAPVLQWLRGAARDGATLDKWLGTVNVWLVQSQSDA